MSNCLVACVVQAWTKSDGALASATSRAKSKAASVFVCAISISLTFRSRTFSRALLNPSDGLRACLQRFIKAFAGYSARFVHYDPPSVLLLLLLLVIES